MGRAKPQSQRNPRAESVARPDIPQVVGPLRRVVAVKKHLAGHVGQQGTPGGGSQPGFTHEGGSGGGKALQVGGETITVPASINGQSLATEIKKAHGSAENNPTQASWIAPDGERLAENVDHQSSAIQAIGEIDPSIPVDDFSATLITIESGMVRHTDFESDHGFSIPNNLTLDQRESVVSMMIQLKGKNPRSTFTFDRVKGGILESYFGNEVAKILRLDRDFWDFDDNRFVVRHGARPVEKHLGGHIGQEGTPGGGSQPGFTHVEGGGGSKRIEVPRLKTVEEYQEFIRANFLTGDKEGSLGRLFIEEDVAGDRKVLTLDDYHEIAESLALIKERFPNMTASVFIPAAGEEVSLMWSISNPEGKLSAYSPHSNWITINSADRVGFIEEHIRGMEGRREELDSRQLFEKETIKKIDERLELLKTPEGRKQAHSMYWYAETPEDQFRGAMFHEFGHFIHHTNGPTFGRLFGQPDNPFDKYGVTARARDSSSELVAENFALWMLDADVVHSDMKNIFDNISREHGGQ